MVDPVRRGDRGSCQRPEGEVSVPQKVFTVLWAEGSESELQPVRRGRN